MILKELLLKQRKCILIILTNFNHLAKHVKWLSFFMSTYLYGATDCVFLSCHVCPKTL